MIDLVVPPTIEDVITGFDQAGAPVDALDVKAPLVAARTALVTPTESENAGAWAEVLAFSLASNVQSHNPWKTYYGPMGSFEMEDGKIVYSPDIDGTPAEVIAHWHQRAQSTTHPVLKARYADLSWDLSRAIAKTNPDPEMARIAIDAYLLSIAKNVQPDIHREFEAAIRGLDLAEMLGDPERIESARSALLQLHRKTIEKAEGLWWKAFDRLIDDKRANLTAQERDQLVADLEAMAARFSDISEPKIFDPHAAQSAVDRLVAYYRKLKRRDDVSRLRQIVGRSFEHAASLGDAMLASALLQTAVTAYRDAGLSDESKRVRVLMEEKITASQAQMQTFTFETTIPKDQMEQFLATVVREDIGSTFARIASEFLERRDRLDLAARELMKQAPLMATVTHTLIAEKRVTATIGSVDDDLMGRVIQQSVQAILFNDIWLMNALDRAVEVHSLTPHHFVAWAARTGLFKDLTLLLEGITAWLQYDSVKAIHILIPQIETGLRAIAEQIGRPTTKAHPRIPGASVAINMGDLLFSKEVTDALGADITLHCLTLYTDPRGFNLRNEMAHGLLPADQMTNSVATRLIHTLLVLGIWRQLGSRN